MILQRYLVVVSLTIGETFPLVVPVSKERLLALKMIKPQDLVHLFVYL